MTKNEVFLLKEMLPIWQRYADAFVFMDDCSTDGTYEFLTENKEKYNILKILKSDFVEPEKIDFFESISRQQLFDEAIKHSGKILCLDTDEYLDGILSKQELNLILETNKNCLFYTNWIQYTDKNKIRVDGKWKAHPVDRVGSYDKMHFYKTKQMHGEHLPTSEKSLYIDVPYLFVSHLSWLADKKALAVKQYHYKIWDYVHKLVHGVEIIDYREYDNSVNNFDWTCVDFPFELKVPSDIYVDRDKNIENSNLLKYIRENVKKYNIPNLNDWGYGLHTL